MPNLKDIEILTHCDVNRLSRAYLMAKTMPEELTVSLVIGYKDAKDKEYSLANKPDNLQVYFEYYDPNTIYPTNRFRNIAFEKSTRDYVFYLDVDFIFQYDFWTNFQAHYLAQLKKGKVFCPIPLFDELKPDYLKAYEAEDLVKSETEATHLPVLKDDFTKTAELFKFHDRWVTYPQKEPLLDMTPVMRSIRNGTILPEPWGILHRNDYLFADESFLGRVKDKQQFVCRLLDSGLKFYSMGDCVMYHLWHPDSRHDINREKENCVNTLLFNRRYLHKYQNFFFLLEEDAHEGELLELLDLFRSTVPIVEVPQGDMPEQVIPVLRSRKTVVSKADFFPEYSVYGYKLVYVYKNNGISPLKSLTHTKNRNGAVFNLGYFSLGMDLNDFEANVKKLQDLTGWCLKESGRPRVGALSPSVAFDDLIS